MEQNSKSPLPPKPASLEIRINSVDDAKSVVQNMNDILDKVNLCELKSIHFLIAKECRLEAQKYLYGLFRCKIFTSTMSAREENTLYMLPHFRSNRTSPAPAVQNGARKEAAPVAAPEKAVRRTGRPRKVAEPAVPA